MKKTYVVLIVVQVLHLCMLIHSESVSLTEEDHTSAQARARHDILIAEGVEAIKEQNVESREKWHTENESPSSITMTSGSSLSALPSSESHRFQQFSRNPFVAFLSNNVSAQRSADFTPSSIAPTSFNFSTSNTQQAIRNALTSGSTSFADISSFLESQSSFLPHMSAQHSITDPNDQQEHPVQEKDFEEQKTESGGDLEDASKMTITSEGNTDSSRTIGQVKPEENSASVHPSLSFQEMGETGGQNTQQMVPYQSPRLPNIRAPQTVTRPHVNRHWANKHAWFATRRPLLRPLFPSRTSPRPVFRPNGKGSKSVPTSEHRTQKYMSPVAFIRSSSHRFYPKRRNMFPSQFQRRPSLFSSLFQPIPSSSSPLAVNHPNQIQTPTSPLLMMHPMNVRNWFFGNSLFSGNRRPVETMNPSLLAFPFPTITNRLPPAKFSAVNNQDPRSYNKRRRNNYGSMTNKGGIKTAASTTSSTYTRTKELEHRKNRTGYRQRSSIEVDKGKREKSRNKKKRRAYNKESQMTRLVSDTRSNKDDRTETLESRIPSNTWKAINSGKLAKKEYNGKKEVKRENMSGRIIRDEARKQAADTMAIRKRVRRYTPELPNRMKRVRFNDSKKSPIIIPVSSYISFIASSSAPSNKTFRPHPITYPHPTQMRGADVTLTAEPTFQLLDGIHDLDKHDIHHHYYYNDRSDSGEAEEGENEFRKQKKDEENVDEKEDKKEKRMKQERKEEVEKKIKQKMKEKKFMNEKGKKKKLEEKKEKNEDEMKTKNTGEKDDNYKSKEEGKLGVYWFKDSGHKKHGWKNVYHKEEWGDSKKFHDIFHDKDWKKKWNKWDNSKEKSKGSKYKSEKKRYAAKKLDDEKKFEKGGHKKWKKEHGSGYEKKEHLDSHQEHESHVKKLNSQKLKGKQSKNNRGVIVKKPKESKSNKKYPSASNFLEYHHSDNTDEKDDHSGREVNGKDVEITNSIDFRQKSVPRERRKHGTNVSADRKKRVKQVKDVTSRRVKHYPDEQARINMQKVREHDPVEEEEDIQSSIENPKYFNRKREKMQKVLETKKEEEGEDKEGIEDEDKEEVDEGGSEQETLSEREKENEQEIGTNKGITDKRLSNNVLSSKYPAKEPVHYYYPTNNVSSRLPNIKPMYNGLASNQKIRLNANLVDHKSTIKNGMKIYSIPPQPGPSRQPFKQLLVSPPSPSSSASFMYPSIPITASTTIYGPTAPIIEHQPNSFQTQSSNHFVPNSNLIQRRPGLAFLSVLKSLTSVPSSVLLPTSPTASFLSTSASTPSLTKLLYQPVASASEPSPSHISSFSYHLQQLQQQKSRSKSSR